MDSQSGNSSAVHVNYIRMVWRCMNSYRTETVYIHDFSEPCTYMYLLESLMILCILPVNVSVLEMNALLAAADGMIHVFLNA